MRAITLLLFITVGLFSTGCVVDLFQDNPDMVKAKVDIEHLTLINFSQDTVYYAAMESSLLARANYVLRSEARNSILPKTNKQVSWTETGSSKSGEKIVVMYWTGDDPEVNENIKSFTVKR